MKGFIKKLTGAAVILFLLVSPTLISKEKSEKHKEKDKSSDSQKNESKGDYAKKLPDFSLKDPAGKTWTKESLSKDGIVLVVTAPILKNKKAQEGWSDKLIDAKSGSKAKLVYLEDMQPSSFKGKAKKGMKKEYKPGKEPILLIDNDGKLRKQLKVPRKKTVVLVYNNDGTLVYSEESKPSSEAANTIWKKAK